MAKRKKRIKLTLECDPLWEEHPKVKKIRAELRAVVRAEVERVIAEIEACAKAEVAASTYNKLQETVLKLVQVRFPELTGLAEKTLKQISNPDAVQYLLFQMATAANETVARNILHSSAA